MIYLIGAIISILILIFLFPKVGIFILKFLIEVAGEILD